MHNWGPGRIDQLRNRGITPNMLRGNNVPWISGGRAQIETFPTPAAIPGGLRNTIAKTSIDKSQGIVRQHEIPEKHQPDMLFKNILVDLQGKTKGRKVHYNRVSAKIIRDYFNPNAPAVQIKQTYHSPEELQGLKWGNQLYANMFDWQNKQGGGGLYSDTSVSGPAQRVWHSGQWGKMGIKKLVGSKDDPITKPDDKRAVTGEDAIWKGVYDYAGPTTLITKNTEVILGAKDVKNTK